jgi:TolA-binding protein
MSDFEIISLSKKPVSAFHIQRHWVRSLILAFCLGMGGWLCAGPIALSRSQDAADDQAAWTIAEIAAKAQNTGDYEFAAEQWQKLLEKFPKVSLVGKAHFNLGVCQEKRGNYDLAVEQFGKAIPMLAGLDAEQQPLAYFYKAFCQFRVGQRLAALTDETSQKQANIELTTATRTFQELFEKYPQFENIDQALFFQGNAFELLKRSDDAIASYDRMLEKTNPNFQFEGLYFVGLLKQEQGKFAEAIDYFDRFRAKLKEQQKESHELLADVDFNKGRALMSVAAQKLNEADAVGAVENFKSAERIFANLVGSKASEEIGHESLFQQAYCLAKLDEQEKAGQAYEQVAAKSDSPFLAQALVNAGRCYLSADKLDKAVSAFQRATELDSPFAVEAASLLSRIYLDQNKFTEAFSLADGWIKKHPDSKMTPYLMYDRADAAFKIPARMAESPALFLSLVEKFPDHSTAPTALYGAAYAYVQLKKSTEAIETVERFAKSYPQNDLLPDVRELKADMLLSMSTNESDAEKEYDQLVLDYPDHEKQTRWLLRSAAAKFFQKKYQPTIDRLQPQLSKFSEPRQLAEAQYWIGASQFFLDQVPAAIANLEKSLAAGETWRSTDETMLTLAQAYLKNKQVDEAKKLIDRMQQELPDSSILERGYYYLGEYAYETEKYSDAFKNFEIVYTKFPESELLPNALYNAAWSKLKLNQAEESNLLFSRLIKEFPKHELAVKAQAGRGAAARKTGNTADSIKDLKQVVETTAPGAEKWQVMFELAMAQIESKAWADAATTLQALIKDDSESSRLDAYHYELAWVLHELDRVPESLEHFTAITKLTPVSKHAGEAFFHLGTEAYRIEDFKGAAAAFQKAIDLSEGEQGKVIREKGLYKLGWTNYKQGQFSAAHAAFNQQVEQFPSSSFAADGFFMRAESLFQQKKYGEAHQAFVAALPVVEGSETIDSKLVSLTHLHGAQAANQVKAFQSALDLATPLTTAEDANASYRADAWLEVGSALQGLNKASDAMQAWEKAKLGNDKTAVRASCLIGDHYFKEKQFETAISQFKEIQYRFGEATATPEIKNWVAYAHYEAARCYSVQASTAAEDQKAELINDAIRQFESLLEKYPDDRLAPQAKEQLGKLRKSPR